MTIEYNNKTFTISELYQPLYKEEILFFRKIDEP